MDNIPTLIAKIDALLPQTQCERCGFKGCRPYAESLARGTSATNLCHPGGQKTEQAIAQLLKRPSTAVEQAPSVKQVAVIVEKDCIGCTKCIQSCPVDAIVGAPKLMHTVIESECTGCELCVDACPVACIEIVDDGFLPIPDALEPKAQARATLAKERFIARNERLDKQHSDKRASRAQKTSVDIKASIAQSIERAKQKQKSHESFKTNANF